MDCISEQSKDFNLILYGLLFIFTFTILTIAITGSQTQWYQSLNSGSINVLVFILFWLLATLISYISILVLQSNSAILCLFVISAFIALGWVSIFFYGQNIAYSLWLMAIVFTYSFWLFIEICYISELACAFMIPILVLYIIIVYSVAHLAYLNNIPL